MNNKTVILLILLTSIFASAKRPYMIVCQNDQLTMSVHRQLKFESSANGWKNYWALVDYAFGAKSGTLNANISWRKDPRPGYNALMITLMDKEEFEFRRQGLEGGSVGFGAIDSREEIKNSFKAKWSTYKDSEDAPELESQEVQLNCQMIN